MAKRCIAFDFEDADKAWEHMNYEIIKDYGDFAPNGNLLHIWDDGKRMLARCRTCDAYILIQKSELHSFTDDDDSYYTDFFPVQDEEEAERLNELYSGFEIERVFPERYLCRTNYEYHWSK